jgi:sarcosine oxidase subunit gamma
MVNDAVQIRAGTAGPIMRLKGWNAGDGAERGVSLEGIEAGQVVGSISGSTVRAMCTSPQDWLLVWPRGSSASVNKLADLAAAEGFFLADLSDAYCIWSVSGPLARELLSKGCGLDLHPRQFTAQQCKRTRFAQIAVVIACVSNDEFELYALRSYSQYLEAWLQDAALELQATS